VLVAELAPRAIVKLVVPVAVTATVFAAEVPSAPVRITDFGAPPYALLKVITVVHTPVVLEPELMVTLPAESVEPAVTLAVGLVPQLEGVPIVGAVVWVDLKCALSICRTAKVLVVPLTLIVLFVVSAVNRVVALAFWIRNAVVLVVDS
jgi:hypothetical protein